MKANSVVMLPGEVSGGLVDVALAVAIQAQAVLLQHVFPAQGSHTCSSN